MTENSRTLVAVWWDLIEGEPAAATASRLDAHERERSRRFTGRALHEYVAAHGMVRSVLETLGWPARAPLLPGPCPLCGAPHGRPRLTVTGAPELSLTHTTGFVAVALSQRVVGLDAEPTVEPKVVDEVSPSLHQQEQLEVSAACEADRSAAFTRAWVRSEAYLKGLGTGLGRLPDLDYVGPCSPEKHPPGWTVTDVDVPWPYHCALAVDAPEVDVVANRFSDRLGNWTPPGFHRALAPLLAPPPSSLTTTGRRRDHWKSSSTARPAGHQPRP